MTKRGGGDQKTIGPVEQAHSSDPGQGRLSATWTYLTADAPQKPNYSSVCLGVGDNLKTN